MKRRIYQLDGVGPRFLFSFNEPEKGWKEEESETISVDCLAVPREIIIPKLITTKEVGVFEGIGNRSFRENFEKETPEKANAFEVTYGKIKYEWFCFPAFGAASKMRMIEVDYYSINERGLLEFIDKLPQSVKAVQKLCQMLTGYETPRGRLYDLKKRIFS